MEREGLLPLSQEPATGPYSDPDKSFYLKCSFPVFLPGPHACVVCPMCVACPTHLTLNLYSPLSHFEDLQDGISFARKFIMRRIPTLGSSSESELVRPKSYEVKRTRANENANRGRNVAQSVSETRGSTSDSHTNDDDHVYRVRLRLNCGHQRTFCSFPSDIWAWRAMVECCQQRKTPDSSNPASRVIR
jgi:hypothetical protein